MINYVMSLNYTFKLEWVTCIVVPFGRARTIYRNKINLHTDKSSHKNTRLTLGEICFPMRLGDVTQVAAFAGKPALNTFTPCHSGRLAQALKSITVFFPFPIQKLTGRGDAIRESKY